MSISNQKLFLGEMKQSASLGIRMIAALDRGWSGNIRPRMRGRPDSCRINCADLPGLTSLLKNQLAGDQYQCQGS